MERFISALSASRYLSVHVQTIYKWIYQDKIPYVRIGRVIRINKKLLDEQLEEDASKINKNA